MIGTINKTTQSGKAPSLFNERDFSNDQEHSGTSFIRSSDSNTSTEISSNNFSTYGRGLGDSNEIEQETIHNGGDLAAEHSVDLNNSVGEYKDLCSEQINQSKELVHVVVETNSFGEFLRIVLIFIVSNSK